MKPSVAGISGGRTSGLMAFLVPQDTILTFQNTGEEHEKTLEFLCRLEDDLQRPIVRLEWRPPPRRGDPPRLATFEVMTHQTLSRRGEPFRELLETLKAYRAAKDPPEPPTAPWAKRRLCTAHLKIRTKHRYVLSMGWDVYADFIGYRFDEQDRVTRARRISRRAIDQRFPLFDMRITKSDVLAFWKTKSYDLEIPEHLGNCKGCFMKDERDLATALIDPATDSAFYIDIEREFGPMRRGGRPSYEQVLAEAPARMMIRQQIAGAAEIVRPQGLDERRYRLIVRQEREPKAEPWSCSCDGAEVMAFEDEEDEVS